MAPTERNETRCIIRAEAFRKKFRFFRISLCEEKSNFPVWASVSLGYDLVADSRYRILSIYPGIPGFNNSHGLKSPSMRMCEMIVELPAVTFIGTSVVLNFEKFSFYFEYRGINFDVFFY